MNKTAGSRVALIASFLTFGLAAGFATGTPQASPSGSMGEMHHGNMAHMPGHMYMTPSRPVTPADQKKADEIVAKAKLALAPYMDYHKALADGFTIFHPREPQVQYHFNNRANSLEANSRFDPMKPTSLLYRKTPDGGYKLIGAMYTDRMDATEDELNSRIPLSIAHWHQHINFCQAPPGSGKGKYFGPGAKFGLQGSIITQKDCDAAGGIFHPHLFGWMVHVYPFETDPHKIWSLGDDDEAHDNMDHSAMPGMQMN